jgi:S1-C subfamily serine protease
LKERTGWIVRKTLWLAVVAVALPGVNAWPEQEEASPSFLATARRSVVRIFATTQQEDFTTPWQSGRMGQGTGTGFVISGKRILTNAHVVSNARFIQVQKDGDAARYSARVAFLGFDCDLAVLTVEQDSFFDGTLVSTLAEKLPELNDEVVVLGYPMGGNQLSITRGVVSRVDYNTYAYSGVDQHLALQVDAAINPGNSGGPVFFDGKVIGVAFQGLQQSQNIGYTIPLPVVKRFLADVATGSYDGYAELGVQFMPATNPHLRRELRLPGGESGVIATFVDPFSAARDLLRARDVLLSIDGINIANDGNIHLDGNTIQFHEVLERKQQTDSVRFEIWRDGKKSALDISLQTPQDPFILRNLYDQRPRYIIVGGLVFSPLNREYLKTVLQKTDPFSLRLRYYAQHAKTDGLYKGKDEFVVLIRRLPHAVNSYADGFVNGIVTHFNGQPVARLADIKAAAQKPERGFHVIEIAGHENHIVLDAAAVVAAEAAILSTYGVSSSEYLGEQ